jgi:hypothetical protein
MLMSRIFFLKSKQDFARDGLLSNKLIFYEKSWTIEKV